MPHLSMEYSQNTGPRPVLKTILGELHDMVGTTDSVEIEKVKSRLIERSDYFVGRDSSRRAFVHVILAILPGRRADLKKSLGQRLHQHLVNRLKDVTPPSVNASITLEIREIDEEFFFRTPAPKS